MQQKCTAHQSEETFLLRSFKFFDFKNSGEVDFGTFQKAIAKIGVMVDESDLLRFFQIYDSNGNNSLDYKEFVDIVFGRAAVVSTSSTQSQYNGGAPTQQQTPRGAEAMSYRGIRE